MIPLTWVNHRGVLIGEEVAEWLHGLLELLTDFFERLIARACRHVGADSKEQK